MVHIPTKFKACIAFIKIVCNPVIILCTTDCNSYYNYFRLINTERIATVDIREFTTYNENSPVSGYGVWVLIESTGKKAHLLHPILFTELIVTEYDYRKGSGATLWPINTSGVKFDASRFVEAFKKRIAFFLENERSFPINTVAKALAEFEEITFIEAVDFINKLSINDLGESISQKSNKANRVYKLREDCPPITFGGRPLALVQDIKENGPASIYQITSRIEGKLKTRTDLARVVTFFVNKLTAQGILEIV